MNSLAQRIDEALSGGEKQKTNLYRNSYYDMSDGINAFSLAVGNNDPKLKELAKKLSGIQDQIRKHLDTNYIWD